MTSTPPTPDFFVGDWRIQPQLNQLDQAGTVVRVTPKTMEVLVRLAREPGMVVPRATLLADIWPDTVVVEDVLNGAIYKLRKIFEDDAVQPRFIETIPKRGYRLLAEVRPADRPSGARLGARSAIRTTLWVALGMFTIALGIRTLLEAGASGLAAPPAGFSISPVTELDGEELEPALSPDGSKVAFIRWAGPGDSVDVYVKTLATGELTRWTRDANPDMRPRWIPGGESLSSLKLTDGVQALHRLFRDPIRSEPLFEVACGCWPQYSWAPDGSTVFYSDRIGQGPMAIYSFSTRTRQRTQLTFPHGETADSRPEVNETGSTIAFVRREDGRDHVLQMKLSDGTSTLRTDAFFDIEGLSWGAEAGLVLATRGSLWMIPKTAPPSLIATSGMHVSAPSSREGATAIAYAQTAFDTDISMILLAVDSTSAVSGSRPISASTRVDRAPQISPDGVRIAFVTDRVSHCDIYLSSYTESGGRLLASIQGGCRNTVLPRWSPDGTAIAVAAHPRGRSDLFLIDVESGQVSQLTSDDFENLYPSWSATGDRIYFGSNREGPFDIWSVNLTGKELRRETENGGMVALQAAGGSLYFTKPGEAGIRVIEGTGAVTIVAPTLRPEDAMNWRLGHEGVFYVDRTPSGPMVMLAPFGSTEVREVAVLPDSFVSCSQMDIAPDGSFLLQVEVEYSGSDIFLLEAL